MGDIMYKFDYVVKDVTELLEKLKTAIKAVGMRTTIKAIESGNCAHAFIAEDADVFISRRITELCRQNDVEYTRVESMKALGEACSVQVPTACAAIKKHA